MVGGLAPPCTPFPYGPGITDVNDDVSLSSDAETSIFQEPILRHRNLKWKLDNFLQRFDTKGFMKNVGDTYDAQFIKQVPVHPRDSKGN